MKLNKNQLMKIISVSVACVLASLFYDSSLFMLIWC